jgi:hypothetical protein
MFTTKLKTAILTVLLLMGLVGLSALRALGEPQSSAGQAEPPKESWQKEFDDVCSKTQDAMTFSQEELADLIRRCDALRPKLEKLDATRKKVYLERLRMCRGLYAYVLDSKRNEKK